jgi:hypothetical protein
LKFQLLKDPYFLSLVLKRKAVDCFLFTEKLDTSDPDAFYKVSLDIKFISSIEQVSITHILKSLNNLTNKELLSIIKMNIGYFEFINNPSQELIDYVSLIEI